MPPEQIIQALLHLVYDKGSAIFGMLAAVLSQATFRRGLNSFLQAHISMVPPEGLWTQLTEAGHQDGTLAPSLTVNTIMDTWALQTGYPVIQVDRSHDGTSATVSQARFLLSTKNSSEDLHNYKWWVPLTYTDGLGPDFSQTQPKVWMKDSQDHLMIPDLPNKDHWVIFNLQQTGYYRVNYDTNNWELITQQLLSDHTVIPTINRAQLIDDATNLARVGFVPYRVVLEVFRYLGQENQRPVWEAMFSSFSFLNTMMANTAAYGGFRKYMASLVGPYYSRVMKVPITATPDHNILGGFDAQRDVVKLACHLGVPDCLKEATTKYQQWMDNPAQESPFPEMYREAMYCVAISEGGEAEWAYLWDRYLAIQDNRHKDQLLRALACSRDGWRIAAYLDEAFQGRLPMRSHDLYQVFSSVARQRHNHHIAWSFLTHNWPSITSKFGFSEGIVKILLEPVTQALNTWDHLLQLKTFKAQHLGGLAESKVLGEALRTTVDNIAWMDHNYHHIYHWLQEQGYATVLRT